jgi:primosomal protein N' (replication factor Y)
LFPRADVDTLILERVSSRAWRTVARPYADMRVVAERLAKHCELRLVMGDSIMPIEILSRIKGVGDRSLVPISELSLIRWRLPAAPTQIVDARSKQEGDGRFEVFSPELRGFMKRALEEDGRIFLFGARKGLAPTTVCGDCGTVLPCKNCGAPVVLHTKGEATLYVCHACGATRESLTACGTCGGWRLFPLGIGLEEIARQVGDLFPGIPVAILDKEHATNDAKAKGIVSAFEREGGILVGSELAFYHLEGVAYAGIVSLDSLFSIPDFHASERIFYLVSRLREIAKKEVLVQTRNIGKHILGWAALGNISDFYQSEIKEREELLYPPFSTFVKISAEDRVAAAKLAEELAPWQPEPYRDSLIIRLPRGAWPDEALVAKLSLLGPAFSIKVDPESLL